MPIEYIPPRDSISVEDLGNSLKIVIPNQSDWGTVDFFIICVLVWFFVSKYFTGFLADLLSGGARTIKGVAVLLIFSLLLLGYLVFLFNPGYEVLVVTEEALYLSRGKRHKPTEYLLNSIHDFCPRINSRAIYLPQRRLKAIRVAYATGGSLSFVYDGVEVQFANAADIQEGRRILNTIQEKFPSYKAVISPKFGYTDSHPTS